MPGNYDSLLSDTSKAVLNHKGEIATKTVDLGSVIFSGEKYYDKMCLSQKQNDRTDLSGHFCVLAQEFILAKSMVGGIDANGVLGLAPSLSNNSYVGSLKREG